MLRINPLVKRALNNDVCKCECGCESNASISVFIYKPCDHSLATWVIWVSVPCSVSRDTAILCTENKSICWTLLLHTVSAYSQHLRMVAMVFIYPRTLGILGLYYMLLRKLLREDSLFSVTLFHPNPPAWHSPVVSKCKPGNAGTWWGGEPLPSVINELPLPSDPQGVSLEWHEQFPATLSLPQGGSPWAADLAQNHLRQPCDSSVTATRLLGGLWAAQWAREKAFLAPLSWGLEEGSRGRSHSQTSGGEI